MDNEKVEAVGDEPPWGQVSRASWALLPARERISREDYEACSTPKPLIRRVLQACLTGLVNFSEENAWHRDQQKSLSALLWTRYLELPDA